MRIIEEHVAHPGESLRFLRIETDRFRGRRHRHRQLELTWIQEGIGLRYVGDSVAPFGPGDLVLLGVDVPHAWVSSGGQGARGATASVLQFPLALLEQPALPELRRARPLAERARLGLLVRGRSAARVAAMLARMPGASAFGRLAGLVEILGQLCARPQDLAPIAASPASLAHRAGLHAGGERRIDRVSDWVARNMHRRLTVAEAARMARVSPASFSRFFRREAGKPFSSYVNDVRCGEACLRLRQSGAPIAQVAAGCGFASISHFNRQFQRRMRTTPRRYRQLL